MTSGVTLLQELSRLPAQEIVGLWEQIKTNRARLMNCPRHHFSATTVNIGDRLTCDCCGGDMSIGAVGDYLLGFVAAGGDPNDVWPMWAAKHNT